MECTSPSKEELLASINPDMRLTKSFFKRVYGYGVTDESFPDKVIAALEAAGCNMARKYYGDWVAEYKTIRDAESKEVAEWYKKECEKQWEKRQKEGEERRVVQAEAVLLQRKKQLLMQKSQRLTDS